jgi:hypothetical protein
MSVTIGNRTFDIDGKYLVSHDSRTGRQVFRIAFEHSEYETLKNLAIKAIYVSPDGQDLVLLFEPAPSGYKRVGNIARVAPTGEVVWWAESTDSGGDTFIALEVDQEEIVATSWECYRCVLDPRTGRILSRTFTK